MAALRWRVFPSVSWLWPVYERVYLAFHPVTPIRPGALFSFRRTGREVELHLDGAALARMRLTSGYSTFRAVHLLRDELAVLAARIRDGELGDVTVVKGTSLIAVAGAVLGFRTRPRPRKLGAALEQYFFVGLDAIYHPRGLRERVTRRWPVEASMTVDELLRRYPEKSDRSTRAR